MLVTQRSDSHSDNCGPLLSVVIPAYQCRRFIQQTLSSVLRQLESAAFTWEVFVVDDASPEGDPLDGTVFEGRVRVFRQPANIGHPANLNAGIGMAAGQLIHVLHADDFVFPGFYDSVVSAFQRFPCAYAVFTQCVVVNESGKWTGVSPLLAEGAGIIGSLLQRLAIENVLQTPSIVVRRDAYQLLGSFDPRYSWTEDWEMWARIAAKFPVVYIDEALSAYRQHGGSSSSRHLREGLTGADTRRCLEAIWGYLPPDERLELRRKAGKLQAGRCLQCVQWAGSFKAALRQVRMAIWFYPSLWVVVVGLRRLIQFLLKPAVSP